MEGRYAYFRIMFKFNRRFPVAQCQILQKSLFSRMQKTGFIYE
jgi:hypothetical protein